MKALDNLYNTSILYKNTENLLKKSVSCLNGERVTHLLLVMKTPPLVPVAYPAPS